MNGQQENNQEVDQEFIVSQRFNPYDKNKKLSGLKKLTDTPEGKTNPLQKSMSKILTSKSMAGASMFGSTLKAATSGGAGAPAATSEMRKVFLESYGVEMDFPGYYYSDSKFVPNEDKYIIVTAWHIIPPGKNK